MKTIVVLPDYDQTGVIQAIVSETKMPLYEALSFLNFPKSCEISGIPRPVLLRNKKEKFIFSQIVRSSNKDYYLKSCRAGKDKTGRTVFLTFIFEFDKNELNSYTFNNCIVNSDLAPKEIKKFYDILNSFGENEKQIRSMFDAFEKDEKYQHLTSESLVGLKYQADWSYGQKKKFTIAFVAFALIIILIMYLKNL